MLQYHNKTCLALSYIKYPVVYFPHNIISSNNFLKLYINSLHAVSQNYGFSLIIANVDFLGIEPFICCLGQSEEMKKEKGSISFKNATIAAGIFSLNINDRSPSAGAFL